MEETQQAIKALDDRLKALERENSRLRGKLSRHRLLSLLLPLLLVAITSLMAAEPKKSDGLDTIDVKKIRILDNDGTPRLVIGTIRDKAAIVLLDEDGKRRAEWWASNEGARLAQYSSTGKELMSIGARSDGALVEFKDLQGNLRLMVGMLGPERKPKKAGVVVLDVDGEPLFYEPK